MSIEIVAIGTSLLWGQGLPDGQKIHTLVQGALQARQTGQHARTLLLAHSGACLGFKADGTEDTHRESRLDGEIPTPFPTLVQQLEEYDQLHDAAAPDQVDLVLVEGSINDVGLQNILNPLLPADDLERMVDTHCYVGMKQLLTRVAAKFTRAQIVVLGYYPPLTEESQERFLNAFLTAVGVVPKDTVADIVADVVINLAADAIKARILENCQLFSRQSTLKLQAAIDAVNAERAASDRRIALAVPDIQPPNAAFASDPWLFGINDDLSPQDELADQRNAACEQAPVFRTIEPVCKRASAGHPNPKGAQAYARAILACLDQGRFAV
ncbi:MAG: SGNH/GDSL hydrolase family protein [Anaerolineae bacterium]|nr:SGNH/GDSL hydrolase family protein [Anaerolineae bacterium]